MLRHTAFMRFALAPAAFLLLAAHVAAADTLPARQPGLWQSVTNVTNANGQPMPGGSNITSVSCVDPATDIKFFTTGDSACKGLTISGSGNTYTIAGTCSNQGRQTNIHVTLVYAGNQAVNLSAIVDSPAGPLNVSSQLTYQGDCLAGMAPGDEGSLANGTFTKTDNINDPPGP
jgi:hypothetical protein